MERKRIEVKLAQIRNSLIRHKNIPYDCNITWLENIEREYNQCNLQAIIAKENPNNHPHVILGDLLDESNELWQISDEIVYRKAQEFAKKLALLLGTSERIILIDPYFDPTKPQFTNVIHHCFQVACNSRYKRNRPEWELHIQVKSQLPGGEEKRKNQLNHDFKKYLSPLIPYEYSLTVFLWQQKKRW